MFPFGAHMLYHCPGQHEACILNRDDLEVYRDAHFRAFRTTYRVGSLGGADQ